MDCSAKHCIEVEIAMVKHVCLGMLLTAILCHCNSVCAGIIVAPQPSPTTADILDGSVTWTFYPGTTRITAQFTPNFGLSLEDTASLLEVDHFNWLQIITEIPDHVLDQTDFHDYRGKRLSTPFVDPALGGYRYMQSDIESALGIPVADDLPFYLDEDSPYFNKLSDFTNDTDVVQPLGDFSIAPHSMFFFDMPGTDGSRLEFLTSLVGVRADGTYSVLRFEGTVLRWESEGGIAPFLANSVNNPFLVDGGQSAALGFVGADGFSQPELNLILSTGGSIESAAAVPEPTTSVLIMSALATCIFIGRGRRFLSCSSHLS